MSTSQRPAIPRTRSRRALTMVGLAAALIAGTALLGAQPASAADTGYVRLAHLSPDTPSVDVYLDSLTGAIPQKSFPGVGYGVVSAYLSVPSGGYAVSMRAPGSPASSPPVLTTQVTVAAGQAYTVAGVGRNADLGLRVIGDDLTLPPRGKAKVRIVQASVRTPVLDVTGASGATIASGIPFASTSSYRDIDPGRWSLRVGPAGGQAANLDCVMADGNVYSLLVLDAPNGGLKIELRADAQRDGAVPIGGMDTGAGGTSPGGPSRSDPARSALSAVGAFGLLAAAAWLGRLRRRRPATAQ